MAGTALVVEHDEQLAHILRFILEREGFEVCLVRDGRSAEETIALSPPPAIATLALMLPHTDGYELLRRIRGTPGWQAVPIIVLTARTQDRDVARTLAAGANEYIAKPFDPDELRACVRRLVKT
ncbi:MAG TPA: response regulator transcription factor [Burkholderiales bacterium]|nr:response regulator transcription factor [Burkholderiales bacterium]